MIEVYEIDEEYEKMSDAINDITFPIFDQISNATYTSLLRPLVCGVIHQLILEGKIKLC